MPKTIFGGDHQHVVTVLTEARKRSGKTQAELASLINRDQTFISLIERRQRRVDVVEFIKIAKALGNDPTALLGAVVERMAR